jgi:hypothetical protein
MSDLRVAGRLLTTILMTALALLLLTVIKAEASPIKPDIDKVLAQPASQPDRFAPARAGWDGPEMTESKPLNLTLEQIGPSATERDIRAGLVGAFVPDYRALAVIGLIILLLRRIRTARHVATAPAIAGTSPSSTPDAENTYGQPPRAA